jgi:hypothetical protein
VNEILQHAILRVMALWFGTTFLVAPALTLTAQLWALWTSLRQRQWLKALLFATPLGYFYLFDVAVKGPYWKGIFGWVIVREEPEYLSLFKRAGNLAGWSTVLLLFTALFLRATQWAVSFVPLF